MIIVVLGMVFLGFMLMQEGKVVSNLEELKELEANQKVVLKGIVGEERVLYGRTKLLVLDNGIELICDCLESFVEKSVEVEGVVSEYEGKRQVEVLKLIIKS